MLALANGAHLPGYICVGAMILVEKPDGGSILMRRAVVTAVGMEAPPRIVIRTLTAGEQVQRRAFLRVPVDIEVRYQAAGGSNWLPARLRDLSEAGACCLVRERQEPGDSLTLELPAAPQAVCVKGVVRHCWTEKSPEGAATLVGLDFLDMKESLRDRIRRMVFEHQLKMCRQKAELRADAR